VNWPQAISLFILYTRTGYSADRESRHRAVGYRITMSPRTSGVALASRTMAEPEPALSIYLVPDSPDPQDRLGAERRVICR